MCNLIKSNERKYNHLNIAKFLWSYINIKIKKENQLIIWYINSLFKKTTIIITHKYINNKYIKLGI